MEKNFFNDKISNKESSKCSKQERIIFEIFAIPKDEQKGNKNSDKSTYKNK